LGGGSAGSNAAGAGGTGGVPSAPNGYVVRGNQILDANGVAVRLRGADLPTLIWDPSLTQVRQADIALLASWGANAVRIGLNQGLWLAGNVACDAACYQQNVATVVNWARSAELAVILDLHFVTANGAVEPQFMEMPDAYSARFWSEVATLYASDGHVLFELFNEPHDVDWSIWKNGGAVFGVYDPDTSDNDYSRTVPIEYQATGLQALYASVRAAGAHNVVIAGGLNWAFDLSGIPMFGLEGYNIAYATHLYAVSGKTPEYWEQAFGFLKSEVPILISEFGPLSDGEPPCQLSYVDDVVTYAEANGLHWTAWAWFGLGTPAQGEAWCMFPALFYAEADPVNPSFSPTPYGERIRTFLSSVEAR
jgi:aryl-phospho-beta-D-glucosidase BglC (GH1 family)